MRRFDFSVLFVSFFVSTSAVASFACGSRTDIFGVLGDGLESGDAAGGDNHRNRDASALDDGASDDGAFFADGARKPVGDSAPPPPNPCGGYQAYAPWPAFQRCSAHVGRTDAVGPSHPVVKWKSQVGVPMPLEVGVVGPPTIAADGTIYVANLFGQLVAFNSDGSQQWAAQCTYLEAGPSAVAIGGDGALYVELDQLYALTSSGGMLWTAAVHPGVGASTVGPATSSVTVSQDGTLYVGTSTGLVSLNSQGTVTYVNELEEQGWTPAINTSDVVYSANESGALTASTPGNAAVWTFQLPMTSSRDGWVQTSPVIAEDGTIYVGALSAFYALDPDGNVKWTTQWTATPPPQTTDTMAIGSDGTVYLVSPDSTLSAISSKGETLWSLPIVLAGSPPVVDGNGMIYLLGGPNDSGDDGILIAVTPKGEVAWQIPLTNSRGGGLAVGNDGTIYASTYPTATLFAIGEGP